MKSNHPKISGAVTCCSFVVLLFISSCVNRNGLQPVIIKYPDGQVKVEGTKLNGKKQGVSRTYYADGQLQTENHWDKDVQVGKSTKWFENGVKKEEGHMLLGEQDGEWKYYDKLDGQYIYSVFYDKGKMVHYTFAGDKYRWRNIELSDMDITFSFPTYLMDGVKEHTYTGYWAMYPWSQKKDIEYYAVIKTRFAVPKDVLKSNIEGFTKDNADAMSMFLGGDANNPSIPNVWADRYEIKEHKAISFKGQDAFILHVYFSDLQVDFKSLIIPCRNSLQMITAYFNKDVPQAQRDRYFESVTIKAF